MLNLAPSSYEVLKVVTTMYRLRYRDMKRKNFKLASVCVAEVVSKTYHYLQKLCVFGSKSCRFWRYFVTKPLKVGSKGFECNKKHPKYLVNQHQTLGLSYNWHYLLKWYRRSKLVHFPKGCKQFWANFKHIEGGKLVSNTCLMTWSSQQPIFTLRMLLI